MGFQDFTAQNLHSFVDLRRGDLGVNICSVIFLDNKLDLGGGKRKVFMLLDLVLDHLR